ncbi:MAG: DUF2238 domain-containing protein, partial [Methylococcales bacterium]
MHITSPKPALAYGLLVFVCLALAISAIGALDALTWLLEVIWVFVGLILIIWRWKKFPLTQLLCFALAIHALVLMYG